MGTERPAHNQRRGPVLYFSSPILLVGRGGRRALGSDDRKNSFAGGYRFVSRVAALPFVCVEWLSGGALAVFHHSTSLYRTVFVHIAETFADGGGVRLRLRCDRKSRALDARRRVVACVAVLLVSIHRHA